MNNRIMLYNGDSDDQCMTQSHSHTEFLSRIIRYIKPYDFKSYVGYKKPFHDVVFQKWYSYVFNTNDILLILQFNSDEILA